MRVCTREATFRKILGILGNCDFRFKFVISILGKSSAILGKITQNRA